VPTRLGFYSAGVLAFQSKLEIAFIHDLLFRSDPAAVTLPRPVIERNPKHQPVKICYTKPILLPFGDEPCGNGYP
jgi:hypothetical protein